MFAVINITSDEKKGFLKRLRQGFPPYVLKAIIEEIPVYDVKVPVYSQKAVNKCRKKLVTELKRDGIDRFLCNGGWRDILIEEGFKYVRYKPYLLNNILNALLSLIKNAQNAEEFNVVLHDAEISGITKELFFSFTEIFRNVTLITENTEELLDIQREIAINTGAATIITDSFASVNDAVIIVSLSKTEQIIKRGRISHGTIILTADEEFKPYGYMSNSIINAFSPTLSVEKIDLCKDFAPWELSAALETENNVPKKEITEFYSFGRRVSVKSVVSDAVERYKLIKETKEKAEI